LPISFLTNVRLSLMLWVMATPVPRRAYKEVRLQQLRSFCETARLESLAAAAKSLDLAGPTVWEQVHALERAFATKLVEPHGRGCRLTAEGRLLASLAAPLVGGIDALQRRFDEAREQVETWLTIAATPRVLVEDLPRPSMEFQRRFPRVRLRLLEMGLEQVVPAVESGKADLGLVSERCLDPANPRLVFEPGYQLETLLVTPKGHALNRRRRIRPRDLLPFPLVNAPGSLPDRTTNMLLEEIGIFANQNRAVEAVYSPVVRCYVASGFGIGLVAGSLGRAASYELHERPLGRPFGRPTVILVWRKGDMPPDSTRTFVDILRAQLSRQR
jgi:DNA-binding transcriptional LysR family regulator